jgi:hypothetical protein
VLFFKAKCLSAFDGSYMGVFAETS